MFKNKKLEMRIVRDNPSEDSETIVDTSVMIDSDTAIKIIRETAQIVTISTIAIIGTVFLARTAEHLITNLVRFD